MVAASGRQPLKPQQPVAKGDGLLQSVIERLR